MKVIPYNLLYTLSQILHALAVIMFSIPSNVMLARIGDMMPPCGVPDSVGNRWWLNT